MISLNYYYYYFFNFGKHKFNSTELRITKSRHEIPLASKNNWYKIEERGCEYKIKLSLLGDPSFAKKSAH